MAKFLNVTWKKSFIGEPEKVRSTVRSLGFHKLGQTIVRPDTPQLRGMVNSIDHLLKVVEVDIE
jgi:large subunit ribosomal protein L30